jgi:large subunit ribosomal protein L17
MKKRIGGYKLNRDTSARRALFTHLMVALIDRESIETTKAKAMAIRPMFEKMLTKARKGSVQARREIHSVLGIDTAVKKLVDDLALRYKGVAGGYTRITPVGARRGDNAPIVRIALTKMTTAKPAVKEAGEKKAAKATKAAAKTTTLVAPKETKVKTVKIAAKRAGKRGDK